MVVRGSRMQLNNADGLWLTVSHHWLSHEAQEQPDALHRFDKGIGSGTRQRVFCESNKQVEGLLTIPMNIHVAILYTYGVRKTMS